MKFTKKPFSILAAIVSCLLFIQFTQAQDKSLLYKISGNDLGKPSYLYGTIHLICPDEMEVTDATKAAINEVDQVVMELDMDDPAFATKMSQISMNEGMANISEELSEEDLATLNDFFTENYSTSLAQLGVMKPIALLSMVMMKGLDCPQPASYEQTFMSLKGDKELIGLETAEYQMSIFDNIPVEEQLQWLVEYVEDPALLREEFDDMMKAYSSKDVEKLHEVIASNVRFAEFGDVLLYERNADWIEKIENIIKEKSSFIAVGAGHLGSEKGVIALLRKEGYNVEPVL